MAAARDNPCFICIYTCSAGDNSAGRQANL
jgi:hypothetical protein